MNEYMLKNYEKQFKVRIAKHYIRKLLRRGYFTFYLRIIMKTIMDELREHGLRECNESTLIAEVVEQTVEASDKQYLSDYYLKLGEA